MTTPYGRQYLNMYLNQANPFTMMNMSGINCGGYDYSAGAELGMFAMNMASVFTYAFIANKTSNYEGGGGGSLSAARTDLETKVEAQLDVLGEDYDVNNYQNAKVEKRFTDAVELADENINKLNNIIKGDEKNLGDLNTSIADMKANLAKIEDKNSKEYFDLEGQIKIKEDELKNLSEKIKNNKAKLEDGGELAEAKAKAVRAQSTRQQEIDRAIEQLNILVPKLKNEQANPATLDAELNYSDGNWLQRLGKGDNAKARQAIRDFRKAKQDYDAMPDGPMKDAELVNLKEIADKALNTTAPCNIKDLDGSVKSGLAFIRNWYNTQK